MRIRSTQDFAAAARGRRQELRLTQEQLANRVGVSRKWVYEFESGRPAAHLGIVLRLLEALRLDLDLIVADAAPAAPDVDLDAILGRYRGV